ncbi:MAG TPA: XdhC family protein [Candidatus Acidoferrum sp.]|nr:XdhC family protein [Candidatus Acidoferrum sp.]
MQEFFAAIVSAIEAREPFALGIISGVRGSSPQKRGAKALFFADGRIVGTLGGGCLEAEVRERARQSLLNGKPSAFDLVLDHDFGWDDGLICGGRVSGVILPLARDAESLWRELARSDVPQPWGVREDFSITRAVSRDEGWLYRETVKPPCSLWIAGSGHVAHALAPLAAQLEFAVTVFDDRPALASRERFPTGVRLRVDAWDKLLTDALPARDVFGLIVTRGHQHDALVLREWVQRPFAFLGMIGSQRKRRLIFAQFIEDGLATEEQLQRVECPVGVNIGAGSVTEIAVSIAGRLVQRRAELNRA